MATKRQTKAREWLIACYDLLQRVSLEQFNALANDKDGNQVNLIKELNHAQVMIEFALDAMEEA